MDMNANDRSWNIAKNDLFMDWIGTIHDLPWVNGAGVKLLACPIYFTISC